MFEKKSYIFSETLGVCLVEDVTRIGKEKGTGPLYYVLRPIGDKDKVSYIPVENHKVMLRELISAETAAQREKELSDTSTETDKDIVQKYGSANVELLLQEVEFVLKQN